MFTKINTVLLFTYVNNKRCLQSTTTIYTGKQNYVINTLKATYTSVNSSQNNTVLLFTNINMPFNLFIDKITFIKILK